MALLRGNTSKCWLDREECVPFVGDPQKQDGWLSTMTTLLAGCGVLLVIGVIGIGLALILLKLLFG